MMKLNSMLSEYEVLLPSFQLATDSLERRVQAIMQQSSLPYLEILQRTKEIKSLRGKLDGPKGHGYKQLSDITDLSGVCVVVYFEDDIGKVIAALQDVYASGTSDDSVNKLKVSDPSKFGYKAWHLNCLLSENMQSHPTDAQFLTGFKGEIQVRTAFMHVWAKIEHEYNYKANSGSTEVKRKFARLASLVDLADSELCDIHDWFVRNQSDIVSAERLNLLLRQDENLTILRALKAPALPAESASSKALADCVKLLLSVGMSSIKEIESTLLTRQHYLCTALKKFYQGKSSASIHQTAPVEFAAYAKALEEGGLAGLMLAARDIATYDEEIEIINYCRQLYIAFQ